ncbi:hypothetical protein HUJ05_009817 [Dendroctonus ponderosae]|nr:hypothetical protein HUJ05_009817 [Dendroctonus ponderosae]
MPLNSIARVEWKLSTCENDVTKVGSIILNAEGLMPDALGLAFTTVSSKIRMFEYMALRPFRYSSIMKFPSRGHKLGNINIDVVNDAIILVRRVSVIKKSGNIKDDTSSKAKNAESSVPGRSSKKEQTGPVKSRKKLADREPRRPSEKRFNHPWMLVTLKGHTGRVLDMDFSANEKYLASSADGM